MGDFWDPSEIPGLHRRLQREAQERYYVGKHVGFIGPKPEQLKRYEARTGTIEDTRPEIPESMLDEPARGAMAQTVLDAFADLRWALLDEKSHWTVKRRFARGTPTRIESARLILRGHVILEQVVLSSVHHEELDTHNKQIIERVPVVVEKKPMTIWDLLNKPISFKPR